MENLEIISTQTTVNAKKVSLGNTVNYTWNFREDGVPKIINFNTQRGSLGDPIFTGNSAISGAYYSDTKKLDIQNNNFQSGDFELYAQILLTCEEITQPTE